MACATCSHDTAIAAATPARHAMSKEEIVAWSKALGVPVDPVAYANALSDAQYKALNVALSAQFPQGAASAPSSGLSNTAIIGIGAVLVAGIGTVAVLATRGKRRRR
jgi:hypothetical protein